MSNPDILPDLNFEFCSEDGSLHSKFLHVQFRGLRSIFNSLSYNQYDLPLDPEIRKHLMRFIEARLEPETTPKEIIINGLKKVWKFESNQYEFLYGEMVGFLMGIGTGMVFEKYQREILPDETDEIGDMVESHASEIRDYLATFKQH